MTRLILIALLGFGLAGLLGLDTADALGRFARPSDSAICNDFGCP